MVQGYQKVYLHGYMASNVSFILPHCKVDRLVVLLVLPCTVLQWRSCFNLLNMEYNYIHNSCLHNTVYCQLKVRIQ